VTEKHQDISERDTYVKITRTGLAVAAVAAASALVLSGCAANENGGGTPSNLSGTIAGVGSSAQGAAQEAWIAAFQTSNPKATITYDPSGSGAGVTAFMDGGALFAGSDSPLKDEELAGTFASCAAKTLPFEVVDYISAIAVVYNVDGVDSLNLDSATIANIFAGKITTWNDPAIAALNAGVTLPATAITAVHRGDESGTTKNFTDYLSKAAPEAWTWKADKVWPADITVGEAADKTSGMSDTVTGGVGTIGYIDLSKAGKLGVANVKVGEKFVAPSAEGAAASYAASKPLDGRDAKTSMAVSVDRTSTDAGTYPLILVSYIIGCQQYADAANVELIKGYLGYIVSAAGQAVSAGVGAAPMTADNSAAATAIIAAIK
jgi:phosphate transport system substrate-binding protein